MSKVDDLSRDEKRQGKKESAKKSPGKEECKTRRKIEEILELRQMRDEFGLLTDDFDPGFEEAYS